MPDIYKDPNPKPEIAIALSDDFTAFLGFMPVEKILANIESLAPKLLEKVPASTDSFLKELCLYLFNELDH
jgi:mannose-6-phosphate isomerase class I